LNNCGYKSQLRVISNGIEIQDESVLPSIDIDEKITILSTGRLASEKSQKTLLEAMKHSKYAHRIQLHFAGHGPNEKSYKKIADKLVKNGILTHQPVFGFYSADELKALARKSYLYIHCAWVEVEGLSCVEALKEGVVPIIAQGKFTAASQFALDERSLFPESDSKALANQIDWWIEHPQERELMSAKYAESVKNYNLSDSIEQIIKMYRDSIGS
jgi:glycosyltransferase involved in cell wall biosynthesis